MKHFFGLTLFALYPLLTMAQLSPTTASYVKTFPRWQMDQGGQLTEIPISAEECSVEDKENASTISVQPTINFLLKRGVPTYLFVGLWMDDQQKKQITAETNHLAQQWTTFDQAAQPNFRIEVFMGQGDGSDDRRLGLVDANRMRTAVEQLGIVLSTTEYQDLAQGFRIVSVPLKMDHMEDLNMDRGKSGTMMLTCIATAKPDPLTLLRMEEPEVEKIAASKLKLEAWKVLSTAWA